MSRNLREHRRITDRRLLIGFFLLVFLVGDGLIYMLYGREAAIFGLLCLSAALVPVVLIVGIMWALQKISEKTRDR
ncbi:MAG: hypothetical protein OEV06_08510 [Anaerolineae bacterium]|nr:hypothetical protein [Anaerolineae bacterium]